MLTAEKTLIVSHHMRKPSQQGDHAVRHRASGSTDILAGADTAYAITRRGDDLTISCVKNRVAVELEPFRVVMEDGGSETGPVRFRYGGDRSIAEDEPGKLQRAREVIPLFLREQHSSEATRDRLLGYLAERGISERTGERALAILSTERVIDNHERGRYRLRQGGQM